MNNLIGIESEPEPQWLEAASDRLGDLLELPADWDSYGGRPIQIMVAELAFEFLRRLDANVPKPEIVPTADGGIQFEWQSDHADIEFRVRGDLSASLYYENTELAEEPLEEE